MVVTIVQEKPGKPTVLDVEDRRAWVYTGAGKWRRLPVDAETVTPPMYRDWADVHLDREFYKMVVVVNWRANTIGFLGYTKSNGARGRMK